MPIIRDVPGLIGALCDTREYGGLARTSHDRIKAVVPRFVVNEEEPLTVAGIVLMILDEHPGYFKTAIRLWLEDHGQPGLTDGILCNCAGNELMCCGELDPRYCGPGYTPYPEEEK